MNQYQTTPLLQLIPNTLENKHFYTNGLSKIIPRLTLKVHSNLDECYELWSRFTTNNSLFDLWDVRQAFNATFEVTPYFYTVYEKDRALAVLPLSYNKLEKIYEWFGSWWVEDNKFLTEDPKFIELLLKICPTPVTLHCISLLDAFSEKFKVDVDPRNVKNISKFKNMNELLMSFKKKRRYNLMRDFNKIDRMGAKIHINDDINSSDFEELMKLNIRRFDGKKREKSDFLAFNMEETFRLLSKTAGSYKLKMVTAKVRDEIAAVDIVAECKDTYYLLIGGSKVEDYPGIGNFMLATEFEDAIKNGHSYVDSMQIDYGWKHRYFDQVKVFSYYRK